MEMVIARTLLPIIGNNTLTLHIEYELEVQRRLVLGCYNFVVQKDVPVVRDVCN